VTTAAREYLADHAVDFSIAAEAGVTADERELVYPYVTPDGQPYERRRSFADGITRQPKGMELSLWWPLGHALGLPAILCEGEADTLAAASVVVDSDHPALRLLCPVGVPGASFPASRAADQLGSSAPVYLVMDGDDAGRASARRIAVELQRRGVTSVVCDVGDGCDLSDRLAAMPPDDRESWLANLLMDHEALLDEGSGDMMVVDDVRGRLGA
jgi:hypothetical protein